MSQTKVKLKKNKHESLLLQLFPTISSRARFVIVESKPHITNLAYKIQINALMSPGAVEWMKIQYLVWIIAMQVNQRQEVRILGLFTGTKLLFPL